MIEALSHITFIVSDLERMSNFLTTIFNAEEIYSSDGKEFSIAREKFFVINDVWIATMEGDPVSQKSYNHVAFRVAESDFDTCLNRIEALGVDVARMFHHKTLNSRQKNVFVAVCCEKFCHF